MSWCRQGDNARSHPVMMRVRSLASDDREPMEFFGFIAQLYEYSGEHYTDYVVDVGAAFQVADGGQAQANRLLALGVKARAMRKGKKVDAIQQYELARDDSFFHIITKAEREKQQNQRNDTRDTELTSKVRFRDGDNCRWCGKRVKFGDTVSHRGGQYSRTDEAGETAAPAEMDHLAKPTRKATLDTLVVSCRACNRRRGEPETDAADWEIYPIPTHPFYSFATAKFLEKQGIVVEPSERPGFEPDTAPATPPTAARQRKVDPAKGRTPTNQDDPAQRRTPTAMDELEDVATDPPGTGSVKTRSAGAGRDGAGGVGSTEPPTRKRARRGRGRPDA